MMKYLVVTCLLLTVALVQAEEPETTTDKRVERDLSNMQKMAEEPETTTDKRVERDLRNMQKMAEEPETTTDKRVERDLSNMQEMAKLPLAIPEAMANAAGKFAEGVQTAFSNMPQMMPGMDGMGGMVPSRRRRAAQP